MNIYELINTLILSLSIATILITLVAFIIYQIKRLNQTKTNESHGIKLSSVFFRRFSPIKESQIADWRAQQEQTQAKRFNYVPKTFMKLGVLFGVLAAVLALTLSFGKHGKKTIKQVALVNKAQKVQRLQEKGLLKEFTFIPSADSEKEVASDQAVLSSNREIITFLRQKNIVLITSNQLRESKNSKHLGAINAWVEFLNRHEIPFEITANFEKFSSLNPKAKKVADLFVLPQHTNISDEFKLLIESQLLKTKFVFTGPIDIDNNESDWFAKKFDITFEKNKFPGTLLASQFLAKTSSQFTIPPGQVLPLVSTDNRFNAVTNKVDGIISVESDYKGNTRLINSQLITKAYLGKSYFWTSWDPNKDSFQESLSAKAANINDYIILQALATLTEKPTARIAWWPKHSKSVTVMSVDVEDEFANIENIIKIFAKHEIPSTLFLVAEFYEKQFSLIKKYITNLELASHGNNHTSFAEQPAQLQFDRIQVSRQIIEEYGGQPLAGFRPPYEEMDDATIDALHSNHLSYIFAGQKCVRLAPCQLQLGPIYFPRVLNDDYALIRNRTLISPERIQSRMKSDIDLAKLTGGAYFLSLHTQIFGKEPYLKIIDNIISVIKKDTDMAFYNFQELAIWWRNRSQLESEVITTPEGNTKLKIVNLATVSVYAIPIKLFNVEPLLREPAFADKMTCEKTKDYMKCEILSLAAGEELEISLSN